MSEKVRERALRPEELRLARDVFEETLPYNRIMIGDDLGRSGRAYMDAEDMPGWGTGDYYVLRLGYFGYRDATSTLPAYAGKRMVRTVFIHELTHVWQAFRGHNVLTESIAAQGCYAVFTFDAGNAYNYTPGRKFCDYNVEQQASIVEDWFMGGMKTEGELYKYIRDHIHTGKPHTDFCSHSFNLNI